jgi:multiple sugar transport system permease protein
MASVSMETAAVAKAASKGRSKPGRFAPNYWPFVIPALIVIGAVIVFPWVFTLWMSVNSWTLGQSQAFAGLDNYARLAVDMRFWDSLWHTVLYTTLSVLAPLFLGTLAALIFDTQFPLRGLLRGIFVMPMMATPVAIALVWTMMFHPQLGVLNYLLSFIGIGPQEWIYNQSSVIPSLVLVETWQWTPLVMLIVLGGLAAAARTL